MRRPPTKSQVCRELISQPFLGYFVLPKSRFEIPLTAYRLVVSLHIRYVYPIGICIDPERLTTRSTVFRANRSQAVRLPKAVAFPDDVHQVEIIRIGQRRLISPVGKRRRDDLFASRPRASDDFMSEREQPAFEKRELL